MYYTVQVQINGLWFEHTHYLFEDAAVVTCKRLKASSRDWTCRVVRIIVYGLSPIVEVCYTTEPRSSFEWLKEGF